jgi:cell division protein FtsQ
MKRFVSPKKPKRRRSRRSERRLGAPPQKMESSIPWSIFAVKPAITFWQINQSRIAGLMVLLLCLWIIYLMFDRDAFYVYGAKIEGNRILNSAEIYAASQADNLSVFWINPAIVKANIEALPNIKTARVKVTLPANLFIKVEERHPEVLWQTGDSIWWIDNEGTFVPPRQRPDESQDRLRIVDGDAQPVKASDKIDLSIIRGAQIVNEHKPEVTELFYTQAYGLLYFTPEGWPVYMGENINMQAKLLAADAVRTDLLARNVVPAFIDMRNPLRVVYQEQ